MWRLPAVMGFGLALMMASAPAYADDGWNPFKERDQARRAEQAAAARAQERAREDRPPPLAPMDGAAARPWLEDNPRSRGRVDESPGPMGRRYSDEPPAPWQSAPGGFSQPPAASTDTESVDRSELQPLSPAASSEPSADVPPAAARSQDFRGGIDAARFGEMIAPLSIPPRSGALAGLWQHLLSANAGPSASTGADRSRRPASFEAIRIEALYRSGLVGELRKRIAAHQPNPNDPVETLLVARTQIGLGEREPGCAATKGLQQAQASLPKPARQDFLLLAALCGVGAGDAGKASLAADLLRAEGVSDALALASLDALASGNPASFQMPGTKSLSLLDYRFLELIGAEPPLEGAEPAFLATVATSDKSSPARILAAEAALALHAIRPADLAAAYHAPTFSEAALAQPFTENQAPPLQRALLFKAFEAKRTPIKKARFARALLDEVRRANGPYMQVAAMLAPGIAELRPSPDLAWFAETAVEINLAGHRIDAVRDWATGRGGRQHGQLDDWLVLADISAESWHGRRGEHLPAAERRAVGGELAPELMHRLVTVLDALDYQIPIPLWEAASKTQQPTSGFLPETGVLSQLQKASQQREQGRVVLLAMHALGPESGETAHMIALGDTIRALKRVGLEAEARQLGLEALFMAWPRSRND